MGTGGGSVKGATKEIVCTACGNMSTTSLYTNAKIFVCNTCKPTKKKSKAPVVKIEKPVQQAVVVSDGNSCKDCFRFDNVDVQIYRNRSEMEAIIVKKDTGEYIDRIPVSWKARNNALDYLSVSKMATYERCPASFYYTYMSDENIEEDSGNYFTKFGTILHTTVEKASQYFMESGIIVNPLSIFDDVWKNYDLTGFMPYIEAKGLIKDYFARNPIQYRKHIPAIIPIDGKSGIEYEWRGQLGGTTFGMQIDYIGRYIEQPHVGILADYKSNRMPFTPEDLAHSIQLRIYMLVCKKLLPDITQWNAGYEMFRYGWQQCPQWSDDDLKDAEEYVANMHHQISCDNTWEEKLNNFCGYNKCRFQCKAYSRFLKNPRGHVESIRTDSDSLEDIENEREMITAMEKIVKTRKDELNGIVKTAIEQATLKGESLVIGGSELQLFSNATQSYRYGETKNVLLVNNALGILERCTSIGKTKMDKELAARPDLAMALSGCMDTNYASAYVVKRKVGKKK